MRNCRKTLSLMGKFFCTAQSMLKKPGPKLLLRPEFPIWSSPAQVKPL